MNWSILGSFRGVSSAGHPYQRFLLLQCFSVRLHARGCNVLACWCALHLLGTSCLQSLPPRYLERPKPCLLGKEHNSSFFYLSDVAGTAFVVKRAAAQLHSSES